MVCHQITMQRLFRGSQLPLCNKLVEEDMAPHSINGHKSCSYVIIAFFF